jgi:hypothetical protein
MDLSRSRSRVVCVCDVDVYAPRLRGLKPYVIASGSIMPIDDISYPIGLSKSEPHPHKRLAKFQTRSPKRSPTATHVCLYARAV